MKIDYNQASNTYDNTRTFSDQIIREFSRRFSMFATTTILDFGCGTGNYLDAIHARTGCRCFGVEPSESMRLVAISKNPALNLKYGDHNHIPFDDEYFDFVYMTDVIHHVPDLTTMFGEIARVLRTNGSLCIVTESHEQIDSRFYNDYFPTLAQIEKDRYPDIDTVVQLATRKWFKLSSINALAKIPPSNITEQFVRNVTEKNWSMFRLLSEEEFLAGLKRLKSDLGKEFEIRGAGASLIWLYKVGK